MSKLTSNQRNQRHYASIIQLPFHPHYVPPGQKPVLRQKPTTGRKKILKTSYIIPSWTLGVSKNNNPFPKYPTGELKQNNSILIGIVPSIDRIQPSGKASSRENKHNRRDGEKIPILFRLSTIYFVMAFVFRHFSLRKKDKDYKIIPNYNY
ncbi:2904_t:CDS:1 [Diversispora eburnea]|uniref:2904_t:CDS:1 n=1 Tax=Diversispora eburnea TaxID=1213867 RepID=A0A9N8ZKT4_9GLOM|nr:2904_t:CDS:1 [Diversispora eburnea]